MHQCIYLFAHQRHQARELKAVGQIVLKTKKNPQQSGLFIKKGRLTRVHPPPEHMPKDHQLLILKLRVSIFLIRELIAVETA